MNPELKDLLMTLGIGLIIGAMLGLAIVRLRPEWAKMWTKFCMNGQWKLFGMGALMFGMFGMLLWMNGQMYFAMLNMAMCVLELIAMMLYGFKSLTPKMERQIDESDLRKSWLRR